MRATEAAGGGVALAADSHAERLRTLLRARHETNLDDWAGRESAVAAPAVASAPKRKSPPAGRKGRAA